MALDLNRVQPPLKTYPPQVNPWILKFVRFVSPFWLRWQCKIRQIETRYVDRLVTATHKFQNGKARYLLAFRHPTTDDPFAMLYLLAYALPEQARAMGIQLPSTPHSGFVYDRGISLWAGDFINWLFPALGGISIFRGKLDRGALNLMRQQIIKGDIPLSMAPEGGTNGKSELISELEPGIAQIGFWAAEDMLKAGQDQELLIIPVGIQYEYGVAAWPQIDQAIMSLEQKSGLSKPPITERDRYQRLYELGIHLVRLVEQHYQTFYRQHYPEATADNSNGDLATLVQNLCDRILRVAESHVGVKPKGTAVDRCRRLEQAIWDRIFRNDIENIEQLSEVERGFADQLASEANYSNWHMKIAESIIGVTSDYVRQHPSPSRYVEMINLMWSVLNRVTERDPKSVFKNFPDFGDRKLIISVAEPISVSERLATYQSSRVAAKECTRKLTEEIYSALESLIVKSAL
ncbi:MAG: 1-acyl-sn-glycerol-3-phosphate acyltransferase [Pseudanabaenaceae cyanobacterium bins.39]|nr:1-acyl-sn-glycerol-3-phosphate acyltransferase [Pseudanabaenaceae cyanobacterium bins.39]